MIKRQVFRVSVNQTENNIALNEISEFSDDEKEDNGVTFVPDAASLRIENHSAAVEVTIKKIGLTTNFLLEDNGMLLERMTAMMKMITVHLNLVMKKKLAIYLLFQMTMSQ